MAEEKNSRVNHIRHQLDDNWKVLESIYDLLLSNKALKLSNTEQDNEKIVNFLQPKDLVKLIDLHLHEYNSRTTEEIQEICKLVIKYSVKTNHGRFHNQLFGQMDPVGLAGAWITEALNTSAYTYEVAPVFSLIETEVIQFACKLVGFSSGDGIFSPGGSISNMYGLSLARYKRYPKCKSSGLFGMRPLVLFTSEESHYSLKKAAHWLGFGADNCIIVKTNERGQMLADDLTAKIQQIQNDGQREAFFVNATAGTTVLGAFDDLNAIADVCERYGLWLHVDGCLGLSAVLSYENRDLIKGIERVNSIAWNPHKTIAAPLQCSLFLTNDRDLLSRCNSIEVNYLFQQDKYYDASYDTGNKSIQCGRKIDAFKFWLMLKARGYGSYGSLIDHAIAMSKLFVKKIRERGSDRYRLVLDEFQYTNVCFWYIPKALRCITDQTTKEWKDRLYKVAPKIKERMVRRGTLMIGYAPLNYRNLGNFFRVVFTIFPILDETELDFILDEIERCGDEEECTY